MLQLSENLYPVDEVIGTFMQCILTRADMTESLFWLWELAYTTPDVSDGLVCIYQLFYSTSNSNIGKYVSRKVTEYRTSRDIRLLADIVSNLRNLEPNFSSYLVNYHGTTNTSPTMIYRHKDWMDEYPRNMRCVFGAIRAKDHENLGFYLARSLEVNGYEKTIEALAIYAKNCGVDIDDGIDGSIRSSGLLEVSSAVSRLMSSGDTSRRGHFLRADKALVQQMHRHFTKRSEKYYLKLSERRMYATHDVLPPGDYSRFSVPSLRDACWYSWEYYAFASTEWSKRFSAYKGTLDHDKKTVVWPDDDHLEAFYEDDNAMDFDEQPSATQTLSIHDIHVCGTGKEWIAKLQETRVARTLGEMKI